MTFHQPSTNQTPASQTLTEAMSVETYSKLQRLESVVDRKMSEFVGCMQEISKQSTILTFEVEEIKGLKRSLTTDLKQTLQQTLQKSLEESLHEHLDAAIPMMAQALSESFSTQTNSFVTNHLKTFDKIQSHVQHTTQELNDMIIQQRRSKMMMGLALVLSTTCACFILSLGFFRFFPQHQSLHLDLTTDQALMMLYGEACAENRDQLTPEDQTRLTNAIAKKLKGGFSETGQKVKG